MVQWQGRSVADRPTPCGASEDRQATVISTNQTLLAAYGPENTEIRGIRDPEGVWRTSNARYLRKALGRLLGSTSPMHKGTISQS